MLSDDEETKLANRLRRIAGLVTAVDRMMLEDSYYVELFTQIEAASGALGWVGQLFLDRSQQLRRGGCEEQQDEKLDEQIQIFRKYSRVSDEQRCQCPSTGGEAEPIRPR